MWSSGSRVRVVGAIVAAAAACGGFAGSAAAAPTWQAPTVIPGSTISSSLAVTPGFLDDPWVAVDGLGNSYAVWGQQPNGGSEQIEVSSRPPGGSWSAAQALPGVTNAADPRIASDAAGDVAAAWRDVNGAATVVRAAVRWAGGAWGAPQTISTSGTSFDDQRVLLDPAGNVLLVWRNSTSTTIEYSVLAHGGSTWSQPATVSPGGKVVSDPNIAIGPTGRVLVIWRNTTDNSVQLVAGTVSGGFGAMQTLFTSAGTINSDPQVGVGPGGEGYAVWQDFVLGTTTTTMYVASAPAGGSFGAPVTLATDPNNFGMSDAQVRVDRAGNALAVWQQNSATVTHQRFATKPAGGSWSAAGTITDDTLNSLDADPEFAPDGTAYLLYHREDSGFTTAFVTYQTLAPGSSTWSAPVNLTGNGGALGLQDPQLRFDAAGNATATWVFDDRTTNQYVQAAGLDGGPLLTAARFPAGGRVGAQLPFSVSPIGVWTPVVSTVWGFGDGSKAAGTSVTHAYGTPGAFGATVTSTDAAGNSTTAAGTVPVTAATISKLRVSPSVFSLAGREVSGKCVKPGKNNNTNPHCRRPIRLRVSYTLDVSATVTFTLTREAPGRKVNGRCVKPNKKNSKRPKCTRPVSVSGKIIQSGTAGTKHFTFNGKIGGHTLGPGTYELIATPTGGKPETFTFEIVP